MEELQGKQKTKQCWERQHEVCPVYCLMSKSALEPGDKELNAAGCQRLKKQSDSGNARPLGVSQLPSLPQSSLLLSEACLLIYQLHAIQIKQVQTGSYYKGDTQAEKKKKEKAKSCFAILSIFNNRQLMDSFPFAPCAESEL